MSRTGIRIATLGTFAGGTLAALLAFSPTAAADPAAPALPGVPGMDLVQQLANAPAMATQLLQTASSLLSPQSATPATQQPTASASINLPQPPAPPQSAPMTHAVGTVPGATPAAAPAAQTPPLLNQLPLAGNIAAIAQEIPGLGTSPSAIPSIQAPMSTGPMAPTSGAPAAAPALPPALNPFSALP